MHLFKIEFQLLKRLEIFVESFFSASIIFSIKYIYIFGQTCFIIHDKSISLWWSPIETVISMTAFDLQWKYVHSLYDSYLGFK